MDVSALKDRHSHQLVRFGILLFLLGLVSGLMVPVLANPRMGLSSHLEGVMSGMFLVILGLIWPRMKLGPAALRATFFLALYGAFANWANTLLAAAWSAGGSFMPMASRGLKGTPLQETAIGFGATSLALAFLAACCLVLWGLRGGVSSKGSG